MTHTPSIKEGAVPPTSDFGDFTLRPLRLGDEVAWAGYLSDSRVTQHTTFGDVDIETVAKEVRRDIAEYSAATACRWAVANPDGDLIGTCGLLNWSLVHSHAELVYDSSGKAPRHRLLGLAIAVLAALPVGGCNIGCWFMPCSVSSSVVTTVRDPSGALLPGVRVEVEALSGETDADGCVVVFGHAARPHNLFVRATKEGYKVYEGDKPWNEYRVEITLEPQSSAGASTATWQVPPPRDAPAKCP